MYWSKHNLFSKIRNSENYFLVNLLKGKADFLNREEAEILHNFLDGREVSDQFLKTLEEIGYIDDQENENKLFRSRYLDFLDARDEDEIQLFFVTNYHCNFNCSYCYQDEYENESSPLKKELITAFFDYIKNEFAGRKKYITLFGGEPLLNSAKQKELISFFLETAQINDLEVCIVTNGYSLSDYKEILQTSKIREIQVTMDGTADVHNSRRFLKNGSETFDQIVKGIDECLDAGISINLRMVVDQENINNLPDFANFVIQKKWTKNPLFKSQLGRNYELHHCQINSDHLFSRISLNEKIFELTQEYPNILEFYKPSYSIVKYLSENGELPDPLFDSCPACKTEWAFDFTGKIYPCTANVGKAGEELGTFFPSTTLNKQRIDAWEARDVTQIEACASCSMQLACGGGCGAVAKNKNGKISSPDCRPIQDILELGFAAYYPEFKK